jgi:hypothetical protein
VLPVSNRGSNAPLVVNPYVRMEPIFKNICLFLIALAFLQFFISLYYHKMVGLETIQTVQFVFFLKILNTSTHFSLNELLYLKYTNGYNEVMFSLYDNENLPIQYSRLGFDFQFVINNLLNLLLIVAAVLVLFCFYLYKQFKIDKTGNT